MKPVEMRVIQNIRKSVKDEKPDIWVRRAQKKLAELEFERLQEEGIISSFKERTDWGCNGSVNYLVQYPD